MAVSRCWRQNPMICRASKHCSKKKRSWIYRGLAEWEDLNRTRVNREYVNGESFLYLGRRYQLQIVSKQDALLKLTLGKFCLNKSSLMQADKHFREFYKNKLLSRLQDTIEEYSSKMGLEITGFKVLELKNRWGSCTKSGIINIHWKCAMMPVGVLDYIVVHELAHHKAHPNHTAAFWRTVEKVLLDYEKQKAWLKFNGAGMSL